MPHLKVSKFPVQQQNELFSFKHMFPGLVSDSFHAYYWKVELKLKHHEKNVWKILQEMHTKKKTKKHWIQDCMFLSCHVHVSEWIYTL